MIKELWNSQDEFLENVLPSEKRESVEMQKLFRKPRGHSCPRRAPRMGRAARAAGAAVAGLGGLCSVLTSARGSRPSLPLRCSGFRLCVTLSHSHVKGLRRNRCLRELSKGSECLGAAGTKAHGGTSASHSRNLCSPFWRPKSKLRLWAGPFQTLPAAASAP